MVLKPYESGGRASGGLKGQLLLKSTTKLKLWNMSYNKGTTLIRIWADTYKDDAGNIKMVPHRDNEGNFGTSFFVQDAVCQAWGKDAKFTVFADVADEANWTTGSPMDIFYSSISNHPDFKYLTERVGKDFPPLSQPKGVGFIKGLILATSGKDYKANPIWGGILQLSSSAKDALDDLLNERVPATDYEGNAPQGVIDQYVIGDATGFEQGKILEFNKESAFKEVVGSDGINLDGGGSGGRNEKGELIESYACRMWPDKPILALPAQKVFAHDEPFESAFNYLTGEQQITDVLVPAFGRSCKDALLFVFGDKDLLPPSFEYGRKTVDMGKTAPSSAQPAQAMKEEVSSVDVGINLDASTDMPINDDAAPLTEDDVPFEGAEVAAKTEPVPQGDPVAAPASATSNALRERLAAANAKKS